LHASFRIDHGFEKISKTSIKPFSNKNLIFNAYLIFCQKQIQICQKQSKIFFSRMVTHPLFKKRKGVNYLKFNIVFALLNN